MPPKPNKETTLSKLTQSLGAQGVTAIAVVDSEATPDPAWFTVAHPAGVTLKVDFTAAATAEQKDAAKAAILAATFKTKTRRKSIPGVAKEIAAKLTTERREALDMLCLAAWVRDPGNADLLTRRGFLPGLNLDETIVQ